MGTETTCSVCGKPVLKDSPSGHCPHCLLEIGFEDPNFSGNGNKPVRVGAYELIELIGRGGMGVVYKARQSTLHRLVALKMLGPHSAAYPDLARRMRLEAEAAGSLSHPNIVTIFEVGEDQGCPFFSMELIEGKGMDKLIGPEGYRFDPGNSSDATLDNRRGWQAVVARTMAKIAGAVDHAHKHGILHRDIKPANVVIDAAGEPHLTDFGLAKVLDAELVTVSQSGLICGTYPFMAPEQIERKSRGLTTATDVYGLGATLYAMLTGRAPFRAETPLEVMRQVRDEPPRHPSTLNVAVDRDLATICLKCLHKDPKRRYESALALVRDLERYLHHEPIEARQVTMPERIWRWCSREPALAGTVAGIALLLLLSTVLAFKLYRGEHVRRINAILAAQQDLFNPIRAEWGKPDCVSVRVSSKDLMKVSDWNFTLDGTERRVVMGVAAYRKDNPELTVRDLLPLVNWLQPTNAAGERILLDLQLYTSYHNAVAGLQNNEVHFMRMDPGSYVALREADPSVTLLAKEEFGGSTEVPGVIFTAETNLGITRLEHLRNRRIGFGEPGSAMGWHLPQAELVAAGLRATNVVITTVPITRILGAVFQGELDAGVAFMDDFMALTNTGVRLRPLKVMVSPVPCWVASGKLEPAVAQALTRRLVELHNPDLLARVDHQLTRLVAAAPADYDTLQKQMDEARLFGAPRPDDPPEKP